MHTHNTYTHLRAHTYMNTCTYTHTHSHMHTHTNSYVDAFSAKIESITGTQTAASFPGPGLLVHTASNKKQSLNSS